MKILIVDDEVPIVEAVQHNLQRSGYSVTTASNAEEALNQFRGDRPDLILLDIMLPGRSGLDLIKVFREESRIPIIFLTAKAEESDKITGFELGADDYIIKPFSQRELAARVKSVLRRSTSEELIEPIRSGDIFIDTQKHEATIAGKKLELSPKEFALLLFLIQNPGRVFSRDILLDRVWGADAYVGPRTVDVHIRWLRMQIESDPENPIHLLTIRGVGYKYTP